MLIDQMLPNTFIAGAQKAGTTTLCAMLAKHPDVVVASPKEPDFFSRAANLATPQRYEMCFGVDGKIQPRVIIDGSNAYMTDPHVPLRIRGLLGEDLQFVFCLRDPVDRMISGYWHQAKKLRDRRTLEEVFSFGGGAPDNVAKEEDERLRRAIACNLVDTSDYTDRLDDPLLAFRYFRNSLYFKDLNRFQATFGPARIKILLFEELLDRPTDALADVANFLGLDPGFLPANILVHRNATRLPRSRILHRSLQRLPRRRLLRRMPAYQSLRSALLFKPPPVANSAIKRNLRRIMVGEVEGLKTLLNRDLDQLWH